jgi:hypothetical protein
MRAVKFSRAIVALESKNGNELSKVMEVYELEEETQALRKKLQVLEHAAKTKNREIEELRSRNSYYKDLFATVVLNPEQRKILAKLEKEAPMKTKSEIDEPRCQRIVHYKDHLAKVLLNPQQQKILCKLSRK